MSDQFLQRPVRLLKSLRKPQLWLTALGIVLVSACTQQTLPDSADARFRALETQLLQTRPLELHYDVSAGGAFQASITGSLRINDNDSVHLEADGLFGGSPVQLTLHADMSNMRGGNGAAGFDSDTPVDLQPALVIGLTRMGILHNLARLTAGQAPDHANGGVQDWVKATSLSAEENTFAFAIEVAGQPSGSATLRLDDQGLPQHREQTVVFPGGSMQVTERYRWVSTER